MRILIAGSRKYRDLDLVGEYVQVIANSLSHSPVIITGGAVGVDDMAKRTAEEIGIETETYYPNWDEYGKKAGILRNEKMVQMSDKVVVFWDGSSRGTKSTIDFALKYHKHLEVIFDDEETLLN